MKRNIKLKYKKLARYFLKGFTLIEIMLVIAILALLASVILVAMGSAREKAKIAKSIYEMRNFVMVAEYARTEAGKTFEQMTGRNCSSCICWQFQWTGPVNGMGPGDACYDQWIDSLAVISSYAGDFGRGIENMKRDPWGSPYMFDENEGEVQNGNACRNDLISSPGPDATPETADDIRIGIGLSDPNNCN